MRPEELGSKDRLSESAKPGTESISVHPETQARESGRLDKKFVSCSAIIPTRNRPADLRLTMQTLLEQTTLPTEIIVIDQSQDQESRIAVEDEFKKASNYLSVLPRLNYVLDPKIVGVSAARNRAIELAQDKIWLFLDDDVIMEPEFLEELQKVYDENPQVHGVSGVITNYIPPPWLARTWMTLFLRGPFLEKRLPLFWNADKVRNAGLFPVAGFTGALMSFRSETARTGRFDTRIGDGEDVDFCLNLGMKGDMVIAPRVRLKHMRSPIGRAAGLWLTRFAGTQGFLYAKNWNTNLVNKLYLGWFCVGLFSGTLLSCARHLSFSPMMETFKALRSGLEKGRAPLG